MGYIVRDTDGIIDVYDYRIDAELAVEAFERTDRSGGIYCEYEIIFEGVDYADLSTMAKINCMSEFLNKVIPYDCEDVNNGDIEDLETTISYWIGEQYQIDRDGNWYDEGRKL